MGFLAIPYPAIDPVALRIGPLAVKWYGLAYVAGLLLGRYYVKALLQQGRLWPSEKRPFTPDKVDDLLLFMTVGVLLGGRLGYVLFYQPQFFLTHPLEIVAVWNGGMSFHGALLASIVAVVLFARRVGADPWSVMDLAAAAAPMGLFFGRLANFINAELWGRPSTVPWAMVFPDAGPLPRHPSQLYEALTEGLALLAILRARIEREGPLPVDAYMRTCLAHPEHGYWRSAESIGTGGDFITAPEISQVFGELIGVWCAVVWQGMGGPAPLRLVELGPGRGTLMRDALRAARSVPPFLAAATVHLIEASAPLRAMQEKTLTPMARRTRPAPPLPPGERAVRHDLRAPQSHRESSS